jgi:hypothetical protein
MIVYHRDMVEGSKRWAVVTGTFAALVFVGAGVLVLEHTLLGYILSILGAGGLATLWSVSPDNTKRGLLVVFSVVVWLVSGIGFWHRRR